MQTTKAKSSPASALSRWGPRIFQAALVTALLSVVGIRVYSYFATPKSHNRELAGLQPWRDGDWHRIGFDAFNNKEWEKAIEAYTWLTQREEESLQAWVRLAYALHQAGHLDRALDAHIRVSQFDRARPWALYNIACIYALKNNKQIALDYLQEAVDAGYRSREPISKDEDFQNLVDDPRFKQLEELAKPIAMRSVYRQLDFLIGTWELVHADGRRLGTLTMKHSSHRYAMLGEFLDISRSIDFTILTYFEPGTRQWRQVWTDDRGAVMQLKGMVKEANVIVFEGTMTEADGQEAAARVTYQEGEASLTRHLIEQSRDGGTTWETIIDATLVPLTEAESDSP